MIISHQEIPAAPAVPCPMQRSANDGVHVVPPDDNDGNDTHRRLDKSSRLRPGRVRFDEQLTGRCIPSHRDLTKEDRQAIWYSKANLATIRQELLKDRAAIRRHQVLHNDRVGHLIPPDTDTFTMRGMEHLVSARTFEKLCEGKMRLIRGVLEEQEQYRQQHHESSTGSCVIPADYPADDCSLLLATLSTYMSAEATARAIAQAAIDQAFVLESR